jgi:hypothetical protein
MADPKTPETVAEPTAGTPTASHRQAILDEHQWRIPLTHPGVVAYQGVPTWAPGEAVASSHPGFAGLHEQGVLERIDRG